MNKPKDDDVTPDDNCISPVISPKDLFQEVVALCHIFLQSENKYQIWYKHSKRLRMR